MVVFYSKIGRNQYEVDASSNAKYLGVRNYMGKICKQLKIFSNDVSDGPLNVRLVGMDLRIKIYDGFLTITDFLEEGALKHVDLNIYDVYKPKYS
jgi:uncharacterized Fe-S radical SAM superfamily protein PflX